MQTTQVLVLGEIFLQLHKRSITLTLMHDETAGLVQQLHNMSYTCLRRFWILLFQHVDYIEDKRLARDPRHGIQAVENKL